jgi:hypothetical protein
VSFTIILSKNGANQRDSLTFLPSQRFSRFIKLFECDEGENGRIVIVDGCKQGIVGGEILPLAAAVKMEMPSPTAAAFDDRRMSVHARGRWQ